MDSEKGSVLLNWCFENFDNENNKLAAESLLQYLGGRDPLNVKKIGVGRPRLNNDLDNLFIWAYAVSNGVSAASREFYKDAKTIRDRIKKISFIKMNDFLTYEDVMGRTDKGKQFLSLCPPEDFLEQYKIFKKAGGKII